MKNPIRVAVSKKKRRFVDEENGFDLDLTYITDSVLAMGFPSESLEGMYRNPLSEVIRFLETRHDTHYKVYNLCSERSYDKAKFHGRVALFPFDDHNAPPLELMRAFCEDVDAYLAEDPRNVAAVHCKAGKGRTGVMICAYLLHTGLYSTARAALDFYGSVRTSNGKGVTIPSQERYVHYYEEIVKRAKTSGDMSLLLPKPVLLTGMTMQTLPHFGTRDQGCNLHFTITMGVARTTVACTTSARVEQQCLITYNPDSIVVRFPMPVRLVGDVKIEFYHHPDISYLLTKARSSVRSGEAGKKLLDKRAKKMCHFWFNTAFIPLDGTPMWLTKKDIDRANKDKQGKVFDQSFAVELRFSEPREHPPGSASHAGSAEDFAEQPLSPAHREDDPTRFDYSRRQHTGSSPVLAPKIGSCVKSTDHQPLWMRVHAGNKAKSNSTPRLIINPAPNGSGSTEGVDDLRPSNDNLASDYSESLSEDDDDDDDDDLPKSPATGRLTELQQAVANEMSASTCRADEEDGLRPSLPSRPSYTSSTSFTLLEKQYSVTENNLE